MTAQNVGVVLQEQALALPDDAQDERQSLLGEAAASVATSLALKQKRGDEVGAALSLSQLGVIHRLLGNLDEAERHMQQALAIHERLDLPDVYKVYAQPRRPSPSPATAPKKPPPGAPRRKRSIAHLRRLAQGDGPPRLPPQLREAFLALCQTLHAALSTHQPIPPDLANTLAQIAALPDYRGPAGHFLQRLAEGAHPDPPEGLPPELTEIFTALVQELRALPPRSS